MSVTIGVVVPCYRQDLHLPRTIAALERALAGTPWRGVLVLTGPGDAAPRLLSAPWTALAPPAGSVTTPGASRMLGFAAVPGDWVLFVDADTELDAGWAARALAAAAAAEPSVAGFGGRLEEWNDVRSGPRPGDPDMNRVGDTERAIELLTTPALYRRSALLAVGGYDARLQADEDFELGLRFAAAGFELRVLRGPAARHWNDPRPSFTELVRRWRHGLAFGPGQALRLYVGRPEFARLVARQWFALFALAVWLAGALATSVWIATRDARPLAWWSNGLLLLLLALVLRKRSARKGIHAFLAWTVAGLGLVVGFFRLPPGRTPHAGGA
jgi:glycosyltransferase involved in cell wall biosynthesis